MITAIDSSILFDVLLDDPTFGKSSKTALKEVRAKGTLIICPVVWAEVRAFFQNPYVMTKHLSEAGINFDPFDQAISDLAGEMWAVYRRNGGKRDRLVSDFLVGAHAQKKGRRLLCRDRGFFRRYFSEVEVITAD